ncbi:hypothetical protein KKC67_03620 [Patescibacteria group bacterium]|nr:hypothetical protein [Patescibacteria group bacterium]MBU0879871.1 hypothetical protein [Patescibacteria group bacterium]MBU1063178.1 hypothetical protein [Patescibacteria group bacterium]MBU1992068.1 hypothetical protein [Patescibacteria group bacterium]
MKIKKNSVMVVIPTTGNIHITVSDLLVKMTVMAIATKKWDLIIQYSQVMGIESNRNTIVQNFLATKYQWLLMMDSDNPPLRNPLELIEYNKDVMVCPTPMWKVAANGKQKLVFNVFNYNGEKNALAFSYQGGDRLFQVDVVGAGCILIKRKVLEKIKKPFASEHNECGVRKKGEDFCFSAKVQKAGFTIWGHWDYICNHYKEVNLLDILKLLNQNYDN